MSNFTFTDLDGHEWDVSLTMATAFRLRNVTIDRSIFPADINLTNPGKEMLELIVTDPGALFALLYEILRPQIAKVYANEPDQELAFLQRVGPETIEAARDAFSRSLSFFSPRVKTFFTQHSTLMANIQKMTEKKMKALAPEMLQAMEAEIDRTIEEGKKELLALKPEV